MNTIMNGLCSVRVS